MAATADKVVVELELKDGQYLAKVRASEAAFTKSQRATAKAAQDAERQIRASSDGISNSLRSAAGALATGATIVTIGKLADGYTRLQNSLKVVGLEGQGLVDIQNQLYDVANRNGVAVGDLAQLYSRVALNNQSLGASQAQLVTVTEAAAAALKVQGLSATEARGPLLQLAQTLGSDIARAEEYNSVIEGIPVLAQAVARGLGVTTAKLGALVRDGKVTTQQYFQALLKGSDELISKSRQVELTIGGSFEVLNNELGRYIGQTDSSLSATQRLSAGIVGLANNLDKIVPALGVIVVLMGARLVGATASAAAAAIGKSIADNRAEAASRAHQRAIDAQAASTARLTALGGGATAAITAQARANEAAAIAASKAGGKLTDLAGGPVGVAVLAFTALAAAVIYGNRALESLVRPTEASEKATRALDIATRNYADAADKAAEATGKEAEEARKAAARKKELAEASLKSAQAKLAEAQATIALIAAEGRRKIEGEAFNTRGDRAGTTNPFGRNRDTLLQAQADAKVLQQQVDAATASIEAANKALNRTFDAPEGPKAKTKKGKSAETLAKEAEARARLLIDIEREAQIEEASLAQSVAKVRELERQAEIEARIRQLKDAGFKADQAQAVSTKVQARLDEARAQDMQRRLGLQERGYTLTIAELNENFELQRSIERRAEYEERLAAYKEVTKDAAEAQKLAEADMLGIDEARLNAANRYLRAQTASHAIRIAELTGNEKLANSLKDQEAILQRTNELRQQGLLSIEAARKQANAEVTAERSATKYGEQREFFASTFSEGIRAAMAGDLNGFLASQFGNLADMALKKLGESIFDSFATAPAAVAQAQAEGVAQGLAFSTTVGPAITASGATAAAAMGSAILTSGTTVAALIAKAQAAGKIASSFGGGRAGGGPVRAGFTYDVGENGREKFVAPSNGYIIPNMKNASASPGMSGVVRIQIGEGEMFSARVTEIAGPLSVQTAMTSVAYSQDQMTQQQKRRGQSLIG